MFTVYLKDNVEDLNLRYSSQNKPQRKQLQINHYKANHWDGESCLFGGQANPHLQATSRTAKRTALKVRSQLCELVRGFCHFDDQRFWPSACITLLVTLVVLAHCLVITILYSIEELVIASIY